MGKGFIANLQDNYKRREILFGFIMLLNDLIVLSLSFFLSFAFRFKIRASDILLGNVKYYFIYSSIGLVIIIILLALRKLYNYKNLYRGMGENEGVIISVIISIFLLIIFNYYFQRNAYQLSRLWIVYSAIILIILLIISRNIIRRLILWYFKKKCININILIVGLNEEGNRIANTFKKPGVEGVNVVGFIDKRNKIKENIKTGIIEKSRILGNIDEIELIVKEFNINRVIISSSDIKYFDILRLLEKVKNLNIEIQMSPSLFEFSISRMKIFEYMGIPLIQIQETTIRGIDKFFKFLIDYTIGVILLIIFIFICPIIGLLIKIDSKGSILYKQERYGKNFRRIKIYKFRTMRVSADKEREYLEEIYNREKGSDFKIKDDPRITRIGYFLRKTSIDELPQVLNVIKGELSVIGPRALAIKEGDQLLDWEKKRMQVNQGITGLWQVSGRSDTSYEERIKLDLYYIQNWSISMELRVIFKTILKVFFGRGAY